MRGDVIPLRNNEPPPEGIGPHQEMVSVRLPVPVHSTRWTYTIAGLNALIWLLMTLMGGSENIQILVLFGAKYNPLIVAGEYWRLLTAAFLHVGILHLAFNTYALLTFGLEVERRFGAKRFMLLYLLAGIMGNALSFVGLRAPSAGASGAIFGLVGATLAYFGIYRQEFGEGGRKQLRNLLVVAGYNLVFGFVAPGIDNLAHLGGLMAGVALGWGYSPHYSVVVKPPPVNTVRLQDEVRWPRAILTSLAVLLVICALIYAGVQIHS